jgi:hypothetical protein
MLVRREWRKRQARSASPMLLRYGQVAWQRGAYHVQHGFGAGSNPHVVRDLDIYTLGLLPKDLRGHVTATNVTKSFALQLGDSKHLSLRFHPNLTWPGMFSTKKNEHFRQNWQNIAISLRMFPPFNLFQKQNVLKIKMEMPPSVCCVRCFSTFL